MNSGPNGSCKTDDRMDLNRTQGVFTTSVNYVKTPTERLHDENSSF